MNVVQKQNQRSKKFTQKVFKGILTNLKSHLHGLKVRLEDGIVGKV